MIYKKFSSFLFVPFFLFVFCFVFFLLKIQATTKKLLKNVNLLSRTEVITFT